MNKLKESIENYIDAVELLHEVESDIEKIKESKDNIIKTTVRGSSQEFPYTERRYTVEGFDSNTMRRLERKEQSLIKSRIALSEAKEEVETLMLELPPRIQRIIKYKYFENMTWEEVAVKIGRGTGDSLRMEMKRFLKNN